VEVGTFGGWIVVDDVLGGQRAHVVPVADDREHEASASCWCKPKQLDDDPEVFSHPSTDGREDFEVGRRKPS